MKLWVAVLFVALTNVAWGEVKLKLSPFSVIKMKEQGGQSISVSRLGRLSGEAEIVERLKKLEINVARSDIESGVLSKQKIEKYLQDFLRARNHSESLTLEGPDWVRLEGYRQRISAQTIIERAREALSRELDGKFLGVTLRLISDLKDVAIAGDKHWSIKAVLPDAESVDARMAVRMEIIVNSEVIDVVPVWFEVKAFREAWVIQQSTRRGSAIEEASLLLEVVDVSGLGEVVGRLSDVKGKVFRIPVSQGQILTNEILQQRPWVSLGEPVAVNVIVGKVLIRAQAEAMESGMKGDLVKVRSLSSSEEYLGTVTALGEIWVGGLPGGSIRQ